MQRYTVRLRPEVDRAAFIEEIIRGGGHVAYLCSALPDRFAARLKSRHYAAVRSDPRVVSVTLDLPFAVLTSDETIQDLPANTLADSWGIDRIDQRQATPDGHFSYGRNGHGVDCYVVDSGIRFDHEQLAGRAFVLPGFDPYGDADDPELHDANGHGTAVASLIAGRNYGVARRARLYSVKVVGPGNVSYPSEFIDACKAIEQHHLGKTDNRPSVANFSLRFPIRDPAINAAVRDLMIAGVSVVIAAGNDNQPAARYSPQSVALDFYARVRITGASPGCVFRIGEQALTNGPVDASGSPQAVVTRLVDAMRDHTLVHGYRVQDSRHEPSLAVDEFTLERWFDTALPDGGLWITATGPDDFFRLVVDPGDTRPLVVGASMPGDHRWNEPVLGSNYGPVVTIMAPGFRLPAAWSGTANQQMMVKGTSFAAPLTSGVAVLHLTGKPIYRPGDPVFDANSPRTVQEFIVQQATQGQFRSLPDGTPNRLLYSYYIAGEMAWNTPEDFGTYDERLPIQIRIAASVLDASLRPRPDAPVTYRALSGLPDWMTLNAATGILYGDTPEVETEQAYAVTVRAESGVGSITRTFRFAVRNVNRPPVWRFPLDPELQIQVVERGTIGEHRFEVIEPDGQPISFTKGNPEEWPDWLTLTVHGRDPGYLAPPHLPDSVLYRASLATAPGITVPDLGPGVPPQDYEALLRASDGLETIDRTVRVRIVPEPNRSPVWLTPAGPLPGIREGDPVDISLLVSDQDGDPLTFTVRDPDPADLSPEARPGLPSGLSLNRRSGRITGTAGKVVINEVFEFEVVVSDGTTLVPRRFSLAVENLAVPLPTWITASGSIGTVLSGETAHLVVLAESNLGFPVTYSLVAGTLPDGLSLIGSAADWTDESGLLDPGSIYGTVEPVEDKITHTFTIRASTGVTGGTRDRQFSITVLVTADRNVVEWVTPAGDIGSVPEETASMLSVRARLKSDPSQAIHYGIGSASLPPDPRPGTTKLFLATSGQRNFVLKTAPATPAAVKVFTRPSMTGTDTQVTGFTWVNATTVRLPSAPTAGTLVMVQTQAENTARDFLPPGMDMAVCNSEALLIGRPRLLEAHQQVEIVMRAYTGPVHRPIGTSAVRTFSFRVENAYAGDFLNVHLPVSGKERLDWQMWQMTPLANSATPLVADARLFRACDRHYGRVMEPRIYLISGLRPPETGTRSGPTAVIDRFSQVIGPHHVPMTAVIGRPRLAVARDPVTNAVLYELLYLPVVDPGAGQDYRDDPPFPPTLINLRRDLATDATRPDGSRFVRQEDPVEILPLWMRTPQSGDTATGFRAALPVAYLKPGVGASVLARIRQTGLDRTLAGRVLTLDRYLIEYVVAGGITQISTKYLKFPPGDLQGS